MSEQNNEMQNTSVTISEDVVATIAGIAATGVAGVAGMSATIKGGFYELLGKKNLSKGVKAEITEQDVKIDIFILVDYGCKIPEVAWEIQSNVKNEVEVMTGLNVQSVNIHINGIVMEQKEQEPKPLTASEAQAIVDEAKESSKEEEK